MHYELWYAANALHRLLLDEPTQITPSTCFSISDGRPTLEIEEIVGRYIQVL